MTIFIVLIIVLFFHDLYVCGRLLHVEDVKNVAYKQLGDMLSKNATLTVENIRLKEQVYELEKGQNYDKY